MKPNGVTVCRSNGLIEKEWLADIFDFGNGTLEVKRLGQDNLEDLGKCQPYIASRASYFSPFTFCTLML